MNRLWHDGEVPSPQNVARHARSPRRRPLHAPVRAWALAEWALVPLRLFLGATFIYAGLQKLANPNFFNAKSPISIHSQLVDATHTSPIHFLLSHLEKGATIVGLLIAFGELAVGIGTLLGLWTRVAALGGLLLSLSLFLTVSFHTSPYFTGADIVFFFAWMPFIVAGGGTRLSLDGAIARRAAKERRAASPEIVPIPFATVQRLCGNYQHGTCLARAGLACDAGYCPVLLGQRAPVATSVAIDSVERRTLVLGGAAAVAIGTAVLLVGAADAVAGRLVNGAPAPKDATKQLSPISGATTTPTSTAPTSTTPTSTKSTLKKPTTTTAPTTTAPTTTSTTTTVPASQGTLLGAASEVPVNQAAAFIIPSNGDPGIVIHTVTGPFVGYDAVCPHAGCTVGYAPTSKIIVCPCHGSEFQVANGDVIVGPSPHGLTKLNIVEGTDGNLYLQ